METAIDAAQLTFKWNVNERNTITSALLWLKKERFCKPMFLMQWCCCNSEEDKPAPLVSQSKALDEESECESIPVAPPDVETVQIGDEIVVFLRREPGDILGIQVAQSLEACEITVRHRSEGLVKRWNDANPGRTVEVGDKLVSVNGVRGLFQRPVIMETLHSTNELVVGVLEVFDNRW